VEDPDAQRRDSGIEPSGVDGVPIVEDEPVGVRHREDFPELLERPGRRGVRGDVDVDQPPAPHLQRHEDVQDPERRGHRDAAVTGDEGLGVIPDEGGPPLSRRPAPFPAGPAARVPADGAGGETRIPTFRSSSAAIRSSPQVGLLRAIAIINRWRSVGSRGRPGRDRQRQRRRNASRCHRRRVAGWTLAKAPRQAKHRASRTSPSRTGAGARRRCTCRSRYKASRFRRKRFSAARAIRDRRLTPPEPHKSDPERGPHAANANERLDSPHDGSDSPASG